MALDPLTNTDTYRIYDLPGFAGSLSQLASTLFEVERYQADAPGQRVNEQLTGQQFKTWLAADLNASSVSMTQAFFSDAYANGELAQYQGKQLRITNRTSGSGDPLPDVILMQVLGEQSVSGQDAYTLELISDPGGDYYDLQAVSYDPATDTTGPRGGAIDESNLVHRTGDEGITGYKMFEDPLTVATGADTAVLAAASLLLTNGSSGQSAQLLYNQLQLGAATVSVDGAGHLNLSAGTRTTDPGAANEVDTMGARDAAIAAAQANNQQFTGFDGQLQPGTATAAIGTGSKSVTATIGLYYRTGDVVYLTNGTNWLRGLVTSYNPSTGALAFTVSAGGFGGSGSLGAGARLTLTVEVPTSLPPTGSAGGDLTGSYPNPTLAAVGTAGTTAYPASVTTDSKGRVTGQTASGITGTFDAADVSSAKRTAVVGANSKAVVETDAAFFGKYFVDEVSVAGSITLYECRMSVQSGGATAWKWFRSVIE